MSRFKKELKKQTRLAIAAAIGFTIAYAWRNYILGITHNLFSNFSSTMPNMPLFLSAVFLTIIGVLLIMISSRLLD